jgi:hypothetical protein
MRGQSEEYFWISIRIVNNEVLMLKPIVLSEKPNCQRVQIID